MFIQCLFSNIIFQYVKDPNIETTQHQVEPVTIHNRVIITYYYLASIYNVMYVNLHNTYTLIHTIM